MFVGPRSRAPRKLGSADLRPLAEALFERKPGAALALLQALWPQVVGPATARRTAPTSIDRGILRVHVPDARWRETLHKMESTILDRLSGLAGRCAPRRLGFMIGPIPSADAAKQVPARVTTDLRVAAPPFLVDAAQVIPDPELREAFVACASLYLERVAGAPKSRI